MIESAAAKRVIKVTLPDGRVLEVPEGSTIRDVGFQIGKRLGEAAVGGRLDGEPEIQDLRTILDRDVALQIVTNDSPDGLEVIRHSAAHIMADAVLKLWPEAKLAIGPAVDDGFYYDIDLGVRISPDEFERIEQEMAAVVEADIPFERCVVDREATLREAREAGERYKAELIEGFDPAEPITVYRHGGFEDLCRGPHVPSTGYEKAFKLMRVAGAYWRGDERNPMLQRIYGTAWNTPKELRAHLQQLEEAAKRDHRKLGKELGIFMFIPAAPASPFFLPKGAILYNRLTDYMREEYRDRGYQEVLSPQIFDVQLWHRSGHYEHYRDNMYFTRFDDSAEGAEQAEYAVKPMNCPGHTYVYAHEQRSYRDLPLRIADFGRLHRFERSGVTSGLTRVRSFSQDDAHIFCTPEQVPGEIASLIDMMLEVYRVFGFTDVDIALSTRPEKSVGSDEIWRRAEAGLRLVLDESGVSYSVNPGDGAFYGPKIDFRVNDAIGRPWQLGTIQLDFSMPERFELTYVTAEDGRERPVMIHRAILGSLERFIGILLEHTGGNLPFWLSPVQARVITINDGHVPYALDVVAHLRGAGFRVDTDFENAKVGAKIRAARLERIPYVLVIGDREVAENKVAVRERPDVNRGVMATDAVLSLFKELEEQKAC